MLRLSETHRRLQWQPSCEAKLRVEREWGRAKSRDKREKYKHLVCQEGTGHINRPSQCVSSFVATTTLGGCSYVNPPPFPQAVRWSAVTHGPRCEKKKGRLFLQHTLFSWWADLESLTEGTMMCLAGLNSSCTVVVTVQDENNNPPVFSQHEVQTFRRTITCSECNLKSPEISTHILLSGCWSNYSPFNLRLFRLRRSHFQCVVRSTL